MEVFMDTYRVLSRMSKLLRSIAEFRDWMDHCNTCLQLIVEYQSSGGVSVAAKQRLVSLITRIKTLRAIEREKFSRVGCGVSARSTAPKVVWEDVESAFIGRISTGAVINVGYVDPRRFLEGARRTVISRVTDAITAHKSVSVNTNLNAEFMLGENTDMKSFGTRNRVLLMASNVREWYSKHVVAPTLVMLEEFQDRDSGWTLRAVLNILVNINKHNPLRGGCNVPLPCAVVLKKAVVNVKNRDNACFLWAVVASLYPATTTNVSRKSSYHHYSEVLRTGDMTLPVTLDQLTKFERMNDVSVNVYAWSDGSCLPLRLTEDKRERHANLLLVQDPKEPQRYHFACIRSMSRPISKQLGKHNGQVFVCERCLSYFYSSERLTKHTVDCQRLNECAVELPSAEDKWLEFKNFKNKERAPFVVYADFECMLEDVEPAERRRTYTYQQHRAYSVGYYIHCSTDASLCRYRAYRHESECVKWFVQELRNFADIAYSWLRNAKPMNPLTREQWRSFNDASACHVCGQPFVDTDKKVRDHCHSTGEYRGAAHVSCNLQFQRSYTIPVVFHNLSGYDAHFVIKELASAFEGQIDLLPVTKERYISFTKHVKGIDAENNDWKRGLKFRFIDSLKFLAASLEKLASDLGKKRLAILRREFQHLPDHHFDLLTRKGVFPYDYVSSYTKLNDTCLPSREAFYNRLNDSAASEPDYTHAVNVWNTFRVQTLGEYSDLYLKTDVLLLADVFEGFRTDCIASYDLDPAHYFTLPSFTWDAMLKYTGVRLELLTDVDMLLFVERGIRGGLSQCSHRYARANNKHLPAEMYDKSKASTYLMYFDVNNLYGWAMSQAMPHGGFRWLDDAAVAALDVSSLPDGEGTDDDDEETEGYLLEVDIEYPKEIHDAHADLPFCPVREHAPHGKQTKLLATLDDKERYVIHYRYLKQCVRHGLRVTRIHRVLRFVQSHWLRDYIQLNTGLRTRATSEFQKTLYKLMNNAVYGKTMENVRNRVDVRLVTRWDGRYGAEALIAKPNFHSRTIFSEQLVAIEMRKLKVKFDKPIYVGMSVLDVSKECLYEFHYAYMRAKFDDECKVLYTDTDSLMYSVECEDVYEKMKLDIARFDTSDYAVDNPYGMPRVNKKVPGLMKDENNGALMTEFVGLRSKMYATRTFNAAVGATSETKKVKGVRRHVVANDVQFNDYICCLRNLTEKSIRQNNIRSKEHEVYTMSQEKNALSPFDDKRCILADRVSTLPWGHYRIPELETRERLQLEPDEPHENTII